MFNNFSALLLPSSTDEVTFLKMKCILRCNACHHQQDVRPDAAVEFESTAVPVSSLEVKCSVAVVPLIHMDRVSPISSKSSQIMWYYLVDRFVLSCMCREVALIYTFYSWYSFTSTMFRILRDSSIVGVHT